MSKAAVVIKREFTEFVGRRAFVLATVLGPLAMVAFFGAQYFFMTAGGGGEHAVAVLDATGEGVGERVVATLSSERPARGPREPATFEAVLVEVPAGEIDAERARLRGLVAQDSLDGYLVLSPDVMTGGAASYEGENATNSTVTSAVRGATQEAVQATRLADAGIDPADVGSALARVPFDATKVGADGSEGSAEGALILGMVMGFAIYLMVMLYGAAIMNGVVEEKQDRVVELVMSSLPARDLMIGKVVGIGAAGLLQMTLWVVAAAVVVVNGPQLAGLLGASDDAVQQLAQNPVLPTLPLSGVLVFLGYFAGGFLLYATVYSILGAVATTAQEAQQLVFPAIIPLILGFFMMFAALENPDGTIAVAGGLIPFTSPLVMPVRVALAGIDPWGLVLSVALLLATSYALVLAGAKIYRIGVFSTGKRASFGEVLRWIRAA